MASLRHLWYNLILLLTLYSSPIHAALTKTYSPLSPTAYTALHNPARGLVYQQDIYLSDPSTYLTTSSLHAALSAPANAGITLIQPMIYLDTAVSGSPLSSTDLASISSTINAIRTSSLKAVVRFAYTASSTASPTEPAPHAIIAHIAQLVPLLQSASDILLTVQLGFIGAWGEGYYTFPSFGSLGTINSTQQAARNAVADALLAAVPYPIQLEMRTPAFKQALLTSTAVSVDAASAFSNETGARIGHFDDCFLASPSDEGTYREVAADGPDHVYITEESRYTVRGGETCVPTKAALYQCKAALEALQREHWSWLHVWNAQYTKAWKKGGCWATIQAGLGYAVGLKQGVFEVGGQADADAVGWRDVSVVNKGFASPMLEYTLEVLLVPSVLVSGSGSSTDGKGNFTGYAATLPLALVDVRTWSGLAEGGMTALPDVNFFASNSSSPTNDSGPFEMFWNIHDSNPTAATNPAYRIMLGNVVNASSSAPKWIANTRINRLGVTVEGLRTNVESGGGVAVEMSKTSFQVSGQKVLVW